MPLKCQFEIITFQLKIITKIIQFMGNLGHFPPKTTQNDKNSWKQANHFELKVGVSWREGVMPHLTSRMLKVPQRPLQTSRTAWHGG